MRSLTLSPICPHPLDAINSSTENFRLDETLRDSLMNFNFKCYQLKRGLNCRQVWFSLNNCTVSTHNVSHHPNEKYTRIITIQLDLIWSNFFQFEQVWAKLIILIQSDPIWLNLIKSDQIWSNLIKSDPIDWIWSNLIESNQIRSNLIQSDTIWSKS